MQFKPNVGVFSIHFVQFKEYNIFNYTFVDGLQLRAVYLEVKEFVFIVQLVLGYETI